MKKILSVVLCLLFVFSLTFTASADTTASAECVSADSVKCGENITITVSVSNSGAFKSMLIVPEYDSNVFELVSGKWLITGAFISDFNLGKGQGAIAYGNAVEKNGNVFQFVLKAKENVVSDEYEIGARVVIKNGSETLFDDSAKAKIIEVVDGNHKYSDWITQTAATVDADGLKYKVCSNCGARIEKVIPRILNFKNKTLSLQSNISIIFRVDPVYFTKHGYSNPVVTFTFLGVEYPVTKYTVNSSGLYEFAFNVVAPHQMKEKVYATVSAEYEGKVYTSAAQEYSIFTYCNNQITKNSANTAYKKVMALLVDILNYGAAAQTYQGYNTNNLANAELTAAQKALGYQGAIQYTDKKNMNYATIENGIATIKSVGLVLQDSVVMSFKFEMANNASVDGLTARVQAAGKTWSIDSSKFTYDASSKRWVINFNGLNPGQMQEEVYIALYKNGKKVSNISRYSIESYGLSTAAKGNAKLAALVEAMAKYGRSAKNYAG